MPCQPHPPRLVMLNTVKKYKSIYFYFWSVFNIISRGWGWHECGRRGMHIRYWWESQKERDCSTRDQVVKVFIASSEKKHFWGGEGALKIVDKLAYLLTDRALGSGGHFKFSSYSWVEMAAAKQRGVTAAMLSTNNIGVDGATYENGLSGRSKSRTKD
jgi:hypothetical protein